jgi:hypothetical protein
VYAMSLETEEILRDLSQNAESVCRHYLPAGRREGSYWMVGDLQNNPGGIAKLFGRYEQVKLIL